MGRTVDTCNKHAKVNDRGVQMFEKEQSSFPVGVLLTGPCQI